jgi:release factor glutamine methyltransferase
MIDPGRDSISGPGALDGDGSTVSWRRLFEEAVDRLDRAGVTSPAVDARRIVEEAAGVEPGDYHGTLDEPATRRGVARFDEFLARRARGEPLQYVLGRWGFRALDLYVDERVLIPRPETEVVAGLVIEEARSRSAASREVLVADLGTGSGAIALSVAVECPRTVVFATDRSPGALAVARANLAGVGRAATRVSILEGSWFDALAEPLRGSLDIVVSNPPYVADDEELPLDVARWEPTEALRAGPTGTEQIECLIEQVGDWLTPDGVFIVELAPHQAATMADRGRALGYRVSVHGDLTGRDRALVARR